MITNAFKQFIKEEGGQDIVEYSLLLVLIGAAAVFVLTGLGTSISAIFSKMKVKLEGLNETLN